MKSTGTIRITALTVCASGLGLGLLAGKLPASGTAGLLPIAIILLALVAAALVGGFVGRSIDKRLGAEPAEIEKIASELATGYLPSGREYGSKGAAAALGLAVDQLSEVFRQTRGVSRSIIDIVHKIRLNAFLASKRESEREARLAEIESQSDELSLRAQELYKAIDFYSFSLEPKALACRSPAQAPATASSPAPSAIANLGVDASKARGIEAELGSLLGLGKPKETRAPLFGSRSKLVLLPRAERRSGAAYPFTRAWTRPQLRLLRFNEQDRRAE